jgi:hypothetical protein
MLKIKICSRLKKIKIGKYSHFRIKKEIEQTKKKARKNHEKLTAKTSKKEQTSI